MTTFQAGRLASLEISTDAGSNWLSIGGVFEATLEANVSELDGSSFDSGGQKEYDPNWSDFMVNGSCHFAPTDAAQVAIRAAVFAKTTYQVRFRFSTGSGLPQYVATKGFATKFPFEAGLDNTARHAFALRISGVSASAQS